MLRVVECSVPWRSTHIWRKKISAYTTLNALFSKFPTCLNCQLVQILENTIGPYLITIKTLIHGGFSNLIIKTKVPGLRLKLQRAHFKKKLGFATLKVYKVVQLLEKNLFVMQRLYYTLLSRTSNSINLSLGELINYSFVTHSQNRFFSHVAPNWDFKRHRSEPKRNANC